MGAEPMREAIGEVLAFGVGVALSPAAVIAAVLMLDAPGGRRRTAIFAASWALSLATVGAVTLLLAEGIGADGGEDAGWPEVLQLVIGAMLLLAAAQQVRKRLREGPASEMPGWMRKVDGLSTSKAISMAVFLASGKPKNLLLTLAAAVALADLGASAGVQAGGLAVFVALGTLAPASPLLLSATLGGRSERVLSALRRWMVRENTPIVAVLCVILAAKLIGDALG